MAFDRHYSVEEVGRILDASEHRPRPDTQSGHTGHAISLHTRERKDVFSRPKKRKDSLFLVSRNSLAEIVCEALNSTSGQRELEKLNRPKEKVVEIRAVVLRRGEDFDILTVYRPGPKNSQTSFDWLSTTNGDGYIVQVLVVVVKIPNSASEEIHIQTAFPEDSARTWRGNIMGR
jgi:hypothetical protein